MTPTTRRGALCLVATLTWGCGSEETAATNDNTVALSGTVYIGIDIITLQGATVCAETPEPKCVTTGTAGEFRIEGVSKHSELVLTWSKDGTVPAMAMLDIGDQDVALTLGAPDKALIAAKFAAASIDWDDTLGSIAVLVDHEETELGIEGASVTLSPDAGDNYSFGADFAIDPSDATTSELGGLLIINVPGNDYELTIVGVSSCLDHLYLVETGPASFSIPVRDGYVTAAFARCLP